MMRVGVLVQLVKRVFFLLRTMPDQDYYKAYRLGDKAYRAALVKGESPYIPALDEILRGIEIRTESDLGLVDIPLELIVGTKTVGRQRAFAPNFMPIMGEQSEFAMKWSAVYEYQTRDGVSDPIVAYEYMNHFYVLEGNKRVSVMKYLGAFSIEGQVTRIIPVYSEDPQIKIFYEYMDFYRRTQINYVLLSRIGSYPALTKACGREMDEIWTEQQRTDFNSEYIRFEKIYKEIGGDKLSGTAGDAFVFYLSIYPYSELPEKSSAQIKKELDQIRGELSVAGDRPDDSIVLDPDSEQHRKHLSSLFKGSTGKQLQVAFLHEKPIGESGWTYAHELGRMHLTQTFSDQVRTTSYVTDPATKDREALIEEAISDGNTILFTTSEVFLEASLRAALKHSEIKILNCSQNRPFKSLRTYYGRMYEAKFLGGMVAGAMAANGRIAYHADYPIYGTIASINAFACGARMMNPRAVIYLHWNSLPGSDLQKLAREEDISVISDVDMLRPDSASRRFGIYRVQDGQYQSLAAPIFNWGRFYERIIRDIVQGAWNSADSKSRPASSYWWGISGGTVDLLISGHVPEGVKSLVELMRKEIYNEAYHPFQIRMADQNGKERSPEGSILTPEQIITMDWLCEGVIGRIPEPEELTQEGQQLTRLQGIYSGEVLI